LAVLSGHGAHSALPTTANVPARHGLHVAALVAPMEELALPATQETHVDCCAEANLPAAHCVHADDRASATKPALQDSHTDAP
jgi:hypothetical protein